MQKHYRQARYFVAHASMSLRIRKPYEFGKLSDWESLEKSQRLIEK